MSTTYYLADKDGEDTYALVADLKPPRFKVTAMNRYGFTARSTREISYYLVEDQYGNSLHLDSLSPDRLRFNSFTRYGKNDPTVLENRLKEQGYKLIDDDTKMEQEEDQ